MKNKWTFTLLAVCCFGWSAAVVAQPPSPGAGVPMSTPNLYAPPVDFVPIPCPVVSAPTAVLQDPPGDFPARVSIEFEHIMRWVSTQRATPLATVGPSTDPIPAALGQPNTQVALGKFDTDRMHYGGKLTVGVGVDDVGAFAIQASTFWLSDAGTRSLLSSGGTPGSAVLARPFFNVVAGTQAADPVAFPRLSSGSLQFDANRRFYGGDLALRYLYYGNVGSDEAHAYFLIGPTYFSLEESLKIQENSQDLPGLGVAGNSYYLRERFSTRDNFFGGQVGIDCLTRLGPVFVQGVAKLGIGEVFQITQRDPFVRITEPNGVVTSSSDRALYISPANAGKTSRALFAVMPEGMIRAGYDFNQYVQVSAGYSVLYLNNVARPGDQIDRNVIVQPVGTTATFVSRGNGPTSRSTDFLSQGLNVALRLSF